MPSEQNRAGTDETPSTLADVLVIGGGPAGAWAALTAARSGASVVLAEKGFVGTGGATAAGNTTMIHTAPGSLEREATVKRRLNLGFAINDRRWVERVIDEGFDRLNDLADWGYRYPLDESGISYRGSLRGPDYLRFMRRKLREAGVTILDQSPALELLAADRVVAGAAGINRISGERWTVRAAAIVLASGGCAFLSKALGTNGLTGDGLLMAAELGAEFSGMEFTGQYGIAANYASVTKGIMYFWATFTDEAGNELGRSGDRQSAVAEGLLRGPVYAVIDKAPVRLQEGMRRGQPNMFLPFDRMGIDPFRQRFPITLRYEGTVRGVGGLITDLGGATNVLGLFAAGDAATREPLSGATSGGGGPNATWAMSTGVWAGRSAAAFAARVGKRHHERDAQAAGKTGLQPSQSTSTLTPKDVIPVIQQEILPLDRSFFRTGENLSASHKLLDQAWREASERLQPSANNPSEIVRARETAAMLATARWIVASAIERRETRGLNRRLDNPTPDPMLTGRIVSGGLETAWARRSSELSAIAS